MKLLDQKQNPNALCIQDIMQSQMLTCTLDTSISTAARLMRERNISSIIVMHGGQAAGIWTEADCSKLNFSLTNCPQTPIKQVMSSPVIGVKANLAVHELAPKFRNLGVRHFVVLDEKNSPIGIVSQTDVIRKQGIEHYLQAKLVANSLKKVNRFINHQASLNDIALHMKETMSSWALIYNEAIQKYGIVTERDLLTLLATGKPGNGIAWTYANYPLKKIHSQTSLYSAYQQLIQHNIRHLGVCDDGNNIIGILSMDNIMSDIEMAYIEELHHIVQQRNEALQESKQHLRVAEKIIQASLDGIMITDETGTILSVNPAFSRVTGYQESEVLGKNSNILSSGKHNASFYHTLWTSLYDTGVWQGEIWNKRKNGEIYPEWLTIIDIGDKQGETKTYAAIFSDISDRKTAEKKIENLAFYDELTQLPNRRLLYDRLDIALATAHRNQEKVALFFIDLDYFKEVNDNYGHRIGDKLLQNIAKRLVDSSKEGDTVARLGGDEFTLLLTEMREVDHISKVCERIIEKLRQPYRIEGHEMHITSSIGIAIYPDDGETDEELIKNADIAMYRAKDIGRNSFQLFTPAMNAHTLERSMMQSLLRLALEKNEFVLNYQIQKNCYQSKVTGTEVLLRWFNPMVGQISPAQFIPMAEELGLITDVDNWVLKHACQQRKIWLNEGVECGRIAVNISPLHFHQGDLVASVKTILAETELPAKLLEIEVTEGCFIKQIEHATSILNELKQMGVTIALDDFGTGFSSLSYLTNLPIDSIKIDASFIAKLPHNFKESQITSAIISLAQSLELDIVAEGVENDAQRLFLIERGCHVIQGYLFSKPVSAQQLPQVIPVLTQ